MELDEIFEQTHKLPSVPKIAQELIASFSQADVDIERIAKKIAQDQVISAKVLRLANSAHFAPRRPVGSIHDAVIVLGFNTVRTLVIATGITGAFFSTPGLDRRKFWLHSLSVAAYARWLAGFTRQNQDFAFTAGLLHNIGELLIHIVIPDTASKIDRFVESGANRQQMENSNIGFDYVQVGEELARRWNFPPEIQRAIKYQLRPLAVLPVTPLPVLLHMALWLADENGAIDPVQRLNSLPDDLLEAMKIDRPALCAAFAAEANLFSGLDELLN
jgi:HD-like signal output (HDOD) protein